MTTQLVNWIPGKDLTEKFPMFANMRIYGTFENPLFLAKDLETFLGLNRTHISRDYDEGVDYRKVMMQKSDGKMNEQNVFTERGLYEVIFRSRSDQAKKFKDFVFIVLKNLRTQGQVTLEAALKEYADAEKTRLDDLKSQNQEKRVYFIRETDSNWVKIGHSKHPDIRFQQAKTWNPRIELVMVLPVNISESDAHTFARLECSEYVREWFRLDDLKKFTDMMERVSENRTLLSELPFVVA